jgi:hypothetical protein
MNDHEEQVSDCQTVAYSHYEFSLSLSVCVSVCFRVRLLYFRARCVCRDCYQILMKPMLTLPGALWLLSPNYTY